MNHVDFSSYLIERERKKEEKQEQDGKKCNEAISNDTKKDSKRISENINIVKHIKTLLCVYRDEKKS